MRFLPRYGLSRRAPGRGTCSYCTKPFVMKAAAFEKKLPANVIQEEDSFQSAVYHLPQPFELERGRVLHDVEVAYTTYGSLNAARDNAIVICHPLTSHSLVHEWWHAMVSPAWTSKYFVVCANILGSCFGTTGPASINPVTNMRYGPTFPDITIRDAVQLQMRLVRDALEVNEVRLVIGGSLGGMQALEWALMGGSDFVKSFVTVAGNSHHSAWQIAMLEMQRQSIYLDPLYLNGHLRRKFGRSLVDVVPQGEDVHQHPQYQVQSYLAYQGQKFMTQFDVNSYVALTHLADSHDVGRNRGGIREALASIQQPALVIGVESDVLYPLREQQELAAMLPHAAFHVLHSDNGHDGFFLEQNEVSDLATRFLDSLPIA